MCYTKEHNYTFKPTNQRASKKLFLNLNIFKNSWQDYKNSLGGKKTIKTLPSKMISK